MASTLMVMYDGEQRGGERGLHVSPPTRLFLYGEPVTVDMLRDGSQSSLGRQAAWLQLATLQGSCLKMRHCF